MQTAVGKAISVYCKLTLDSCQLMCYNNSMIKSFKHKGLEKFFTTGSTKGIQAIHATKLQVILTTLNVMRNLEPLKTTSYRLHQLKGDMKDLWSITVQANWRITFQFDERTADVYIVDYQDYH